MASTELEAAIRSWLQRSNIISFVPLGDRVRPALPEFERLLLNVGLRCFKNGTEVNVGDSGSLIDSPELRCERVSAHILQALKDENDG